MKKKAQASSGDGDSEVEKAARAAIEAVFSDRSVTQGETANRLRALRDEIDVCLETLDEDDDT